MPLWAAIPLIVLAALAGTCAAYHATALIRVLRAIRLLPTARDGLDLCPPAGGWPSVCIIIPAHDEEDVIGRLVRSLRASRYDDLRIVLVLDRCTDGTEDAARAAAEDDARIEIIVNGQCPDDWAGKVHAVWRGVQDSSGARDAELLLFADADTEFDPSCIRATVALLDDRRLDMLSLLSTLVCDSWYERIAQPAAAFELARQYPLDAVNRTDRPRPFANGQFMLFRREAYDAIGGHEAVKNALLEDIAFARRLAHKKRRHPFGCLLADGMLRCHMYRSWPEFRKGWRRIYTEAATRRSARLRRSADRLVITGVLLPAASVLALLAGGIALAAGGGDVLFWITFLAGLLGIAAMLALAVVTYRVQAVPRIFTPLYPLGAWLTAGILREAARGLRDGIAVSWGGRQYTRAER